MMRINGHWEDVSTWQDVVRVVREYYNEELADKAEEIICDLIDGFKDRIEELSYYDAWDDDWCDD